MKENFELQTIAKYQLGNTSIEIRARGPLTDEAVERFNEKSQFIRLIKNKREETGKDDSPEIGVNDGET